MFFLLRAAFWLSLVALLLPSQPSETRSGGASRSISTFEAIGAAQSTLEDLQGFCGRNPAACDTGRAALETVGAEARDGLRRISARLDERTQTHIPTAPGETGAIDAPHGARTIAVPLPQARPLS